MGASESPHLRIPEICSYLRLGGRVIQVSAAEARSQIMVQGMEVFDSESPACQ